MHQNLTVEARPGPAISPVDPPAFHHLEPLIPIKKVCAITSLSRATVLRRVEANLFPKPMVLSHNRRGGASRVAWRLRDVSRWIAERPQAGMADAA